MRILVIGGTGFIGRSTVRELTKERHEVTVFHRGQTTADLPLSVSHIYGDRRELRKSGAVFRDWAPEVVLDTCAYDRDDVVELNRAIGKIACRVALISSMDVYRAYAIYCQLESDQPRAEPFDEDAPLRSVLFPYRKSAKSRNDLAYRYDKIPVEQFIIHEMKKAGTILRLGKVYGPGDPQRHLEGYSREIDRGTRRLNRKRAQWRWSRAHVENAAAAIAKAVTNKRKDVQVYNIADEPVFN
jgi:nucleoside-diphosphate-sugar epimerase